MRSACHQQHVREQRMWTHCVSSLSVLFHPSPSFSLSLSLLRHSPSISLARWPGFWELKETDRVFDWGGDAIIASCTGPALFFFRPTLSSPLCFFRCDRLPGFPLLMEFLKHGIMRGVNQGWEKSAAFINSLGEARNKKEIYKRVQLNACLPHGFGTRT